MRARSGRGTGALAIGVLALALAGCETDEPRPRLDAEVSLADDVATVVRARWAFDDAPVTEAYVDYGTGDEVDLRAPARLGDDGVYEALLLGIKPNTEVTLRAGVDTDDGAYLGDEQTIATGGPPPSVLTLTRDEELYDPERATDGFLLTGFLPGPAVILDADGDVVWWHDLDADYVPTVSRMYLADDGRSLQYQAWTTAANDGLTSDRRAIVRVAVDGSSTDVLTMDMIHHDFVQLGDGTLASLAYDPREIDGETVVGDRLLVRSPDGVETTLWSVWDHVPYDPEQEYEDGERWGHCNALDYDPAEDVYYLSCRYSNSIFKIDRASGEVLWEVGVDKDFEIVSGDRDEWFLNQHQFQVLDDGILIFDNGNPANEDSEVVQYRLGEDEMVAERVWSYAPDPPLGVPAFGDVHRFPSGNTLIIWGAAGRIDEVTADGEVVRRLDLELGAGIGYVEWMESLYR